MPHIPLSEDPFTYYPTIYDCVFQVVYQSFWAFLYNTNSFAHNINIISKNYQLMCTLEFQAILV